MKVNYRPKRSLKQGYFKPIVILVTVFVLGAIIFPLFEGFLVSASSPIWGTENTFTRKFARLSGFLKTKNVLVRENAELKEELSALKLESLASGWEAGDLLLAERSEVLGAVPASVILHPPRTPYDVIIIDAGSKDSITLGDKVSLPEGLGLGTISEVFETKAKVRLYSTSGEETEAFLERDNLSVILEGQGGGNFKLNLSHERVVERGDRIFSSGLSPELLAVVAEINARPTDAFKEVLAYSPANIFDLRFVLVRP